MSTKLNDMLCKGLVIAGEDAAFDIMLGDPASSDPAGLVKGNAIEHLKVRDEVEGSRFYKNKGTDIGNVVLREIINAEPEGDMGYGSYTEGGTAQCQALYDELDYGKAYCCQMVHTPGEPREVLSYLVDSAEIVEQAAVANGLGKTKFGAYLAAGADRVAAGLFAMTATAIFMA